MTPSDNTTRKRSLAQGAVVLCLILLGGLLIERLTRPPGGQATPPTPMPPLLVEGWINGGDGADPSRETLLGQHVVVDNWATWCPPCRQAMPRLAELHGRWSDQGVTFLGLTSETSAQMDVISNYAQSVPGFIWPIGYGAGLVWEQMGVEEIPTLILYDPDGRSVWRGHDLQDLDYELRMRIGSSGEG